MSIFTSKALVISDTLDAEKALDPSALILWHNVQF